MRWALVIIVIEIPCDELCFELFPFGGGWTCTSLEQSSAKILATEEIEV